MSQVRALPLIASDEPPPGSIQPETPVHEPRPSSTAVTGSVRPQKNLRPIPRDVQALFDHQLSKTEDLPPPDPLLNNLTRSIVEILAGARDLDQIGRWVSDEVYRTLLKRTIVSARARQARGERASRPAIRLGQTLISEPASGVLEAVTVVHGRGRSRAVAIRLEGLDGRWRATAVAVL